ncbi:MAG: hypothetical protein NC350_03975 [Corallococcus sp.]|nr:hypothetical protein [Corallococcus sp.]
MKQGVSNKHFDKKTKILLWMFAVLTVLFLLLPIITRVRVSRDNTYTDRQQVALYILTYKGELPKNFVTKEEYRSMPYEEKTKVNIGGNTFENREGLIDNPDKLAMVECDIYTGDKHGGNRGAERFVFFADGSAVYYTSDHYKSFAEMTSWSINITSNCLWIAFGVVCAADVIVVAVVLVARNKRKRELPLQEEESNCG